MNDLLSSKMAAQRMGISPGTLENWRCQGRGPAYIKLPGKTGGVRYDPADIEAWKDAHRFQSTSETM